MRIDLIFKRRFDRQAKLLTLTHTIAVLLTKMGNGSYEDVTDADRERDPVRCALTVGIAGPFSGPTWPRPGIWSAAAEGRSADRRQSAGQ